MKPDLKLYQHANASIFKEILENKESRCFVQAVSQWKLYSTQKKRRVSYNVKQNFARKTLGKAKPISSEGKIL